MSIQPNKQHLLFTQKNPNRQTILTQSIPIPNPLRPFTPIHHPNPQKPQKLPKSNKFKLTNDNLRTNKPNNEFKTRTKQFTTRIHLI